VFVADTCQPALGVTHRGGAIAIERSEVARTVDERIAKRKRLRHAHEGLVERGVTVGMVIAHDIANDLRALAVLDVGGEVLLPHRVKDAALNRLETIAHIGERARRNDRQRVVQVAGLRRFVQRHRFRAVAAAIDDIRAAVIEQRAAVFLPFRQVREPPFYGG
jgi:hypothetical protein